MQKTKKIKKNYTASCESQKKFIPLRHNVFIFYSPKILVFMKKLFSFVAVALMSIAMFAGPNDLLWDYSAGAPSSNPDNGLTYSSTITDGPGKNNGLYGIKLNSSGYAAFTKAAVAGTLKLGFGPRSGTKAASLAIYTWSGDTPAKETLIATTAELTEYGYVQVELTAEQNNIYIARSASVETALQVIQFTEFVPRTFVDFKLEFRTDPMTVILPEDGTLPAGVLVEGTKYNGGQHGIYGGAITVPVDGPVKFTIGACQYSGSDITVTKDGAAFTTISNNASCGEQAGKFAQNVTYTYTGEAATLVFTMAGNTYVPYFFAEACDITPCEVIFKDQNGTELGRVETYEGATLAEIPYTEANLPAVAEGYKFRGWYYTSGKKATIGDVINGNTTIQALVTPIEVVETGAIFTYPLNDAMFYPENHESIEIAGGSFHDGTHGWYFGANGTIKVQVAGNAVIVVTMCTYSETGALVLTDAAGVELGRDSVFKNETSDGATASFRYTGEATTLTLTVTEKAYIHKVVVYNVLNFVEKDETTGYYMVPAGDAAAFILAITEANSKGNAKIFLPNGLYDLGETVLTAITGNNISIIGESMEGTIIKNAPDVKIEGISSTATLHIIKNVAGTYLQDLTLQNALDYYKNDNGRAVCLWDQGTQTVCKNVRMLSYQDTYYSNMLGAVKYFEDCEIHGTVDFICGDGSVYFKNNLLYCEKRKAAGGGEDCITANNGIETDKGYVFEGCTIKSECPTVSLGRAWNNTPKCAYLNTTVDFSAGNFSFEKEGAITRWTHKLMNANSNAWPIFGEYNTRDAAGNVLSPASNVVTFVDPSNASLTKEAETILTAEQAATYTMANTLGEWAATAAANASQVNGPANVVLTGSNLTWDAIEGVGAYLVEKKTAEGMEFVAITTATTLVVEDINAEYVVRAANAKGGFGLPAIKSTVGVENIQGEQAQYTKVIKDGKLFIMRDGKVYDAMGSMIR